MTVDAASADSEMGLLAGADRIEGTLFGNGERTGNVDIVTLGYEYVFPGCGSEDWIFLICRISVRFMRNVPECRSMREVRTAELWYLLHFPDLIRMPSQRVCTGERTRDLEHWTVPYLPIDPTDVGRNYDADVIRINSQSGKGGVGYILETKFGLNLPPKMREAMGYAAKAVSDHKHKELHPDEIFSSVQIYLRKCG